VLVCVGQDLLFTLEYEDAAGNSHWLKVHKVRNTDGQLILQHVAV